MSRLQAVGLVVLRTLIGWHFLYEAYFKLLLPGWTRAGVPLARWSAAGYLGAATGPLAGVFHSLGTSSLTPWIDRAVPAGLLLVGLSLTLGLFTRLGCLIAIVMLSLFYLSAIPTTGVPVTGQEGNYLLVSKNLIELAAVVVVMAFRTERIAGIDLLLQSRRAGVPTRQTAA
jgi:thiosulfate dehydrogenase [quinone] large subunit